MRSPLYLFSYIYLLFPFIYSQQTLDFWPVVKWESWITTVADISQTRKPELLLTSLVILNSVVGLLSNQLQLFNPLWTGVCKTSCWWNHHLNIFFFFFYLDPLLQIGYDVWLNLKPNTDIGGNGQCWKLNLVHQIPIPHYINQMTKKIPFLVL